MTKETFTKIDKNNKANIARIISLRGNLEKELKGIKTTSPTAYTKIKREFDITGSRRSVLKQITAIIEELSHGPS